MGIANIAVPAKPWGEADVEDSLKLVLNTGLDIADNHKLYLFGNYANRDVTTAFFYRSPMNRNGVSWRSKRGSEVELKHNAAWCRVLSRFWRRFYRPIRDILAWSRTGTRYSRGPSSSATSSCPR